MVWQWGENMQRIFSAKNKYLEILFLKISLSCPLVVGISDLPPLGCTWHKSVEIYLKRSLLNKLRGEQDYSHQCWCIHFQRNEGKDDSHQSGCLQRIQVICPQGGRGDWFSPLCLVSSASFTGSGGVSYQGVTVRHLYPQRDQLMPFALIIFWSLHSTLMFF